MTTREAAARYYADFLQTIAGREPAIYNPNDAPLDDLPIIFGFNNGGRDGWWNGCIMAQDGEVLGGHLCSNEGYMLNDLGILEGCRPDRHEDFRKHYPDGYRMMFVSYEDVRSNTLLMQAIELSNAKCAEAEQGVG